MIRRVKDGDLLRLLSIYNYYIRETEVSLELQELKREEFLERIHQITGFYPWIVYEENEIVYGYAYLNVFNSRKAYATTADLSIYIDPERCHSGIGTELYQAIEKLALSLGICKIVSLITSSNRGSLAFHKAMGFKKLTNIKNVAYKHGKWVGVTFMEKDIQNIVTPTLNPNEPAYKGK